MTDISNMIDDLPNAAEVIAAQGQTIAELKMQLLKYKGYHKYEDWKLFGEFVLSKSLPDVHDLESFIEHWSMGDWAILETDFPEWVTFFEQYNKKA